jgi:recombinational DNA repair ATPase RecF
VFAVVVIGAPGAGKTSVLEALSDALLVDDIRHFGYERLLVAATVETDADLRAVVAAVGAEDHAVVRLEAASRRFAGASSRASPRTGPGWRSSSSRPGAWPRRWPAWST